MKSITQNEAERSFGDVLEAARDEPVMIRRDDEKIAVLMSSAEYDKLRGIRIAAFDRICNRIASKAGARGLTDERFETLMSDVS